MGSNKKPFEPEKDFVKVSRALFTLYTRLPDFRAHHALIYEYLCDKYNVKYGYAFPTQAQMYDDMRISIPTQSKAIKTLKKYGLIDYKRPVLGANYVYYVKAPIEDPDEFYKKYPDVPRNITEEEPPEDVLSWL
ncbi:hypothetical protein [Paenibacillus larvae]|uniref:Helix-turn-helix domain-containing protein n=1 Tax=Paenibacillus larvae subsp. larvae TaxID=147375 RepID=A0A6C0QNB2_9BACL|nr:hypothetical protein [Paenibacillus larvae]QHZ49921.1 hypothetical protein ERICV_00740 [Paenibacillus larvae subsp. larvae]